jgi:hypothetical protein
MKYRPESLIESIAVLGAVGLVVYIGYEVVRTILTL